MNAALVYRKAVRDEAALGLVASGVDNVTQAQVQEKTAGREAGYCRSLVFRISWANRTTSK
ncbi:hypothetical protein SERLA73DRAFT_176398 [Serpula lacrymans var. lacrymans S7.3]|uniref:Uncharacterized protein n=1 Tax=Serpula lacrymans var. lacrymans (strain S7.3) TaxID=936435 RepID=F8PMU5_SERL3|nr:hypothetical protein SERLA73DRAFT_176398 [Serpula lacrymans var. lacrymans S7.3]